MYVCTRTLTKYSSLLATYYQVPVLHIHAGETPFWALSIKFSHMPYSVEFLMFHSSPYAIYRYRGKDVVVLRYLGREAVYDVEMIV